MRIPVLLTTLCATALVGACTSYHDTMANGSTSTDAAAAETTSDAASALPLLDRDAAPLIAEGRYATATFALG